MTIARDPYDHVHRRRLPTSSTKPVNDDEDDDDDIPADDDGNRSDDDDDDAARMTTTTSRRLPVAARTLSARPAGTSCSELRPTTDLAGAGDDVIIGRGGADAIVRGEAATTSSMAATAGTSSSATTATTNVHGGADADMIYGDAGEDRIFGDDGRRPDHRPAPATTPWSAAPETTSSLPQLGDGTDTYFGDEPNGGSGVDTLDMSAITAATSPSIWATAMSAAR